MFPGIMELRRDRRVRYAMAALTVLAVTLLAVAVSSQRRGGNRFAELESRAIAERFVSVTTGEGIESGLFSVRATGVSTQPVVNAARDFLVSLDESQRQRVLFPVDDPEWRRWANQHFLPRQGVSFAEMGECQREAALW